MAKVVPLNRADQTDVPRKDTQKPSEVIVFPRVNFQQLVTSWAGGGGHNHVKPRDC
jgi:hypothetical protein